MVCRIARRGVGLVLSGARCRGRPACERIRRRVGKLWSLDQEECEVLVYVLTCNGKVADQLV